MITPFDPVFDIAGTEASTTSFPMTTIGSAPSHRYSHYLDNFPSLMMESYEDILLRCHKNIVLMIPRVPRDLEIPIKFNEKVFDEAVNSVQTLVLHDTWPKFVEFAARGATSDRARPNLPRLRHFFWPYWHRFRQSIA
jgi:hypothetical protein